MIHRDDMALLIEARPGQDECGGLGSEMDALKVIAAEDLAS